MKKRMIAVLLCLAMLGAMLPLGAIAQGTEDVPEVPVETAPEEEILQQTGEETPEVLAETEPAVCIHGEWTAWDGTGTVPLSGNIVLTDDVVLTGEIHISSGTLSICLNGFNITAASGSRIFQVTDGAQVHIYDCDGTGKLTGADYTNVGGAVYVKTGAAFNLHGGSITGNTTTKDGGAVSVADGIFNMYGGSITDNHTSSGGGAVCAGTNSQVNIYGGSISGNSAKNGGAIVTQGTNPKVLLKDCAITGNSATNMGGGIYVGKPDSVTLSGKLNITGNTAGSNQSNLFVVSTASEARPVAQKDLDKTSTIGIGIYNTTKSNVLVSSGATEDTLKCYTPDDDTKIIEYKNGQLLLAEKPVFVPVHANTEGYTACNHDKLTWTGWASTTAMPTASGNYFLGADVKLSDSWKLAEGVEITLCLNGYDIIQEGTKQVIVMTGGKLNICDCTAKTENGVYSAGKITGADTSERGAGLNAQGGAEFNLYDGCIEGNTSSSYGGGVYVIGATFNMHGGVISNNHADSQAGGGICTNGNAVVNVTGGSITGNSAKNGGAVVVQGAENQVLLKNTTITSNTATNLGGGIYVGKPDSVTLSGKLNITGNTAGSNQSNLFVVSTASEARPVAQKDLDKTSTIGIGIYNTTKSNVLVKSGATEATLKCYTPDDDTKIIEYKNGQLLLVDKPAFVPVHANTEGYTACDHDKLTWIGWDKTDSLPTQSGNYFLGADVELTKVWNAGEDKEITICLNGYSITQVTEGQRVIRVGTSTVNICDCTAHTDESGNYISGKITGGNTDDSDAAGNAGAMLLTGEGTFRLYDGNITDNHTEGNGVIVVQKGFNLEIHGGAITQNSAGKQGGAVYVSRSTVKVTGGTIAGNEAVGSGGAMYIYGGTFTMEGGLISENESTAGGGGGIAMKDADASNKAVVTVSGGEISKNVAKLDGSGIRMDSGEFTLSGGKIKENGREGGAGGGLRLGGGKATISGGEVIGNIGGNAAGIFANCDLTISGGEITANIGSGNGPGVYMSGAKLTMSGGKIANNEAGGNGGGVYLAQASMEMTGGEVSGNRGGMGGGIYNYGGSLVIKDGLIQNNAGYKLGGGGVYSVNCFESDNVTVKAEASLVIEGGTITGNTSKTDGAGVRADSGKFKMTGGLISGNTAEGAAGGMSLMNIQGCEISGGTVTKNKGGNAAGVYFTKGTLTISGGEFSYNEGTGSGAGMMITSSEAKFSGGVIKNNTAKGDGAGLYVSNATLTLCGGKIQNNTAQKMCGGLLAQKDSKIYFSSGTISGNSAKSSAGGMLIQTGSILRMSGGSVSNNKTERHGGGIYINKTSSATVSGGTISGNSTTKSGAGIYVGEDGYLALTGGTISGNKSTTQGGGLVAAGKVNMTGGLITKNEAKLYGGGVYITEVTMTFSGGTVEDNYCVDGGGFCVRGEGGVLKMSDDAKVLNNKCEKSGGGILVQGQGYLEMDGGEVSGNYAPNGGGGIRLHNCGAEIVGAKINDNISNGAGAGIYSNLSLILKDSEVCNNKIVANSDITVTRSSAAIRTYNESTLEMENVKVTGNSCDGRAGAIEIAYNVDAIIKNCTFADNTSTEQGGTFYIYWEGQAYLYDCTIEGGSAPKGGVVSMDAYGEIEFHDCLISGNQADVGGVAYQGVRARAVFDGCTIKNNVAKQNASVIWANGDVVLSDTLITGNQDQSGSAAVYLSNEGADTESYIPGVYEIIGNTVVCGNEGGDLVLQNNAFVNIPGDGLGADAKIQVKLQDQDITRWIIGPYNYEVSADGFLVTRGGQSLSELFMGSGESVPDGEEETQPQQEQPGKSSLPVVIGTGAIVLVLAIAVILVAILRKKNKK